jgi:formylglycine-generating enzyme required for sulfatase activity
VVAARKLDLAPIDVNRRLAYTVLLNGTTRSQHALLVQGCVPRKGDTVMTRSKRWVFAPLVVLLVVGGVGVCIGSCRESRKAALYAAGEAAMAARRWDEAVVCFESVVDADPGYGEVQNKLAQALDNSVAHVPRGEFVMGSDTGDIDERPQRLVYLDAFEIDRYEVTNVQYRRFLMAAGRDGPRRWEGRYEHLLLKGSPDWDGDAYPPGEAMYPVAGIQWQDAIAYCTWVGKRLPTEADWEKAARGTDGRTYPWGEMWEAGRANTSDSGLQYPEPVGSHPSGASPYGVLDMSGNLWEWVSDLYDSQYYSYASGSNPAGPSSGTGERVLRGGAWDSPADQARTSYRNATHFFGPNFRVGFRCARSASR